VSEAQSSSAVILFTFARLCISLIEIYVHATLAAMRHSEPGADAHLPYFSWVDRALRPCCLLVLRCPPVIH